MRYQIEIAAILDQSWSDWLGGVSITTEKSLDGSMKTILLIDDDDPAKIFGILDHLRDLNLTLISVTPVNNESKKKI